VGLNERIAGVLNGIYASKDKLGCRYQRDPQPRRGVLANHLIGGNTRSKFHLGRVVTRLYVWKGLEQRIRGIRRVDKDRRRGEGRRKALLLSRVRLPRVARS
jgi:hypothetical protein